MSKDDLAARLRRAGIDPQDFAALIAPLVVGQLKRERILAAAVQGLMVGWNTDCSAQRVAEIAERVTEAVMREEERRGF